jgi:uncharacterized Zn finger protein
MSWYDGGYGRWAPYVPVAQRRAKAAAHAKRLEKKRGQPLAPIKVEGRTIARSFWGKAWCDNLEAYSDFSNRLPRGRTYVRNGSVIDLQIAKGKITALVSGSEIYELTVSIDTLLPKVWKEIQRDCARSVASLIDLLQGRFDRGVMERLTRKEDGLFPKPKEIKLSCSCPDYAGMCKHIAAVMYGVGARLDHSPELLFTLRNVDHLELISQAVSVENLDQAFAGESEAALNGSDLSEMFGIELESVATKPHNEAAPKKVRVRSAASPKTRRAAEDSKKAGGKPARKSRKTTSAFVEKPPVAAKPKGTNSKAAPNSVATRHKQTAAASGRPASSSRRRPAK